MRTGHRKKPVLVGLQVFVFLPLFPLYFIIFYNEDIFGDVQEFIYSGKKRCNVILNFLN